MYKATLRVIIGGMACEERYKWSSKSGDFSEVLMGTMSGIYEPWSFLAILNIVHRLSLRKEIFPSLEASTRGMHYP